MNVIWTGYVTRLCGFALAAVVAGCATPAPRPAQVITMGVHASAPDSAFPAEGGIWRLNDGEFKALGPVPVETVPSEAASIPGRASKPPAESQNYRSYGYVMPLPFFIYYGPRFSFAYRYPGYWPRYRHAPFSHDHRAWRFRRR